MTSPAAADLASRPALDIDIAIIGAGISGINTAYHVQAEAPAGTSYLIFEGRNSIGGTWDLFRYPGIRSDSDVHTFGFPWRPWTDKQPLAAGEKIRSYMQESAAQYGITKNIRFQHKIRSADWSSENLMWTLTAEVEGGEIKVFRARFIVLGTGYYNYEEPLNSPIPGIENFKGTIIHPQFWPEQYDYSGKNMVIIGSGATAVTIVPSVAEKVSHVTMLQRSPGYILPLPMQDTWRNFSVKYLPLALAHRLTRLRWIIRGTWNYYFCRLFPEKTKALFRKVVSEQLPNSIAFDPHFKPRYNPWDQRLCVCPDGDFYSALRSGKADVATGQIKQVTENEIRLESGEVLRPDIIVTATGLRLRLGGNIKMTVDGSPVDIPSKYTWKGHMLQDVPNLLYVFGYLNASWTLSAEASALMLVRLLWLMKKKNIAAIVPHIKETDRVKEQEMLNLSSTYLKNAEKVFPKVGSGPWHNKWTYLFDLFVAKYGNINSGLSFISSHV